MSSEYNAGAAASFKLEKAWSKLERVILLHCRRLFVKIAFFFVLIS